jgi:hypothetical protein
MRLPFTRTTTVSLCSSSTSSRGILRRTSSPSLMIGCTAGLAFLLPRILSIVLRYKRPGWRSNSAP